ncbi:MAG: hypothetical protein PVI80_06255, partial [Anaerolineae bacterium]
EQARYAVLAYERAQQEWPWLGVINTWFFKRASDAEREQAMYYFRLVEPDFRPMPVYEALKDYMHSAGAQVLYPGRYQEDHWALIYEGAWETRSDADAELGAYKQAEALESRVTLTFDGTDLWLKTGPGVGGTFSYTLDGGAGETVSFAPGESIQLAQGLPAGQHALTLRATPGPLTVDSLTIDGRAPVTPWLVAGGIALAVALIAVLVAGIITRRRPWYARGRGRG